nr:hypothetical protein [Cereibacter sphaeroides]
MRERPLRQHRVIDAAADAAAQPLEPQRLPGGDIGEAHVRAEPADQIGMLGGKAQRIGLDQDVVEPGRTGEPVENARVAPRHEVNLGLFDDDMMRTRRAYGADDGAQPVEVQGLVRRLAAELVDNVEVSVAEPADPAVAVGRIEADVVLGDLKPADAQTLQKGGQRLDLALPVRPFEEDAAREGGDIRLGIGGYDARQGLARHEKRVHRIDLGEVDVAARHREQIFDAADAGPAGAVGAEVDHRRQAAPAAGAPGKVERHRVAPPQARQ